MDTPRLVLLDLDETLLPTATLAEVRHGGVARPLAAVPAYAGIRLHPRMQEVVEQLASRTRVGIVSSSPRWYVDQVLSDHLPGIDFCVVVTYDDVGQIKPSPEPLLTALARTGVAIEDSVYVGDALVDHEACLAIGMPFIAAGWALGAGFSGPVRTAPKPDDLLELLGPGG